MRKLFLSILILSLSLTCIVPPAQAGLTFLADYRNENIDAAYSLGSGTATFTATRSASAPATYIDRYGTMQITTTSDDPRFTHYSYDSTGLISTSGVYVEGSQTNYFPYSISTDETDNKLDNWGASTTGTINGVPTYSTVDITSTFNIGATVKSQRIQYTGAVGDNGTLQNLRPGNIIDASQDDIITFSCYIRTQTGQSGVTAKLYIIENGTGTPNSNTTITPTSEWTRVSLTRTITVADTTKIDIVARNDGVTEGDSVDLEIALPQVEQNSYATSFIPTTTAALTRNAEVLKYATLGNRTAATEAMILKLYLEYANNTLASSNYIIDTDTKRRYMTVGTGNDVRVLANATDSSSSTIEDLVNTSWSAFDPMTLAYNMQSGTSPYIAGFYQGVANGTNETTDDFTANAFGTYFYVGDINSGGRQTDAIFSQIAFFDRTLTAAEHLEYHNNGVSVIKLQGATLQGVAA